MPPRMNVRGRDARNLCSRALASGTPGRGRRRRRGAAAHRDHWAAARGDDDDAAAGDTSAGCVPRSQLERAGQLVEHGSRFELGERGADAAAHAPAERDPCAGGWALLAEAVDVPSRRLWVDVWPPDARASCKERAWPPPAASTR